MATNDIYELIDFQTYFGQEIENVYHFRRTTATFVDTVNPNVAATFLDSWVSKNLPDIVPLQSSDILHTRVTCRNLFDDADAWDRAINVSGTANVGATDDLPAFVCYGFDLGTNGLIVRDGKKRIAGVIESAQSEGIVTNPTFLIKLQTCADRMLKGVRFSADSPVNMIGAPTVVKRVRGGAPGGYTYRLPANQSESVWADIGSAVFKFLLTSQVSRKVGG